MFNKIFTFAIRCGVTFGLGILCGFILQNSFETSPDVAVSAVILVWVLGGIYAILKFNNHYNIGILKKTDNKLTNVIHDKNKRRIEKEMLRIRELRDKNILTEDEYTKEIKLLKDSYS